MNTRIGKINARRGTALTLGFLIIGGCAWSLPPTGPPAAAARPPSAPLDRLQEVYRQAVSDLDQGRLESARTALEGLLREDSGRLEIHNALGVLLRRQGRTDLAIGEYQSSLAIAERGKGGAGAGDGAAAGPYNNLGIAYREAGQFDKAEEAYRKAVAQRPDWETVHFNMGVLYDLYLNRPSEALGHYRDYLRLHGRDETVEVWVADLEQRLGPGGEHAKEP